MTGFFCASSHWPDKQIETSIPIAGLAHKYRNFAMISRESYFHVFNSTVTS